MNLSWLPSLIATAFLLASCHSIDDAAGEKESTAYFKADFPDILLSNTKSIRGRHVLVRDAVGAYLVFQVQAAEATAILSKGFQISTREEFKYVSQSANQPDWWTPTEDGIEYFKCDPWRNDMSYTVDVIGFDRKQNRMYFCHSAFD